MVQGFSVFLAIVYLENAVLTGVASQPFMDLIQRFFISLRYPRFKPNYCLACP